jgi:hypothetical protein
VGLEKQVNHPNSYIYSNDAVATVNTPVKKYKIQRLAFGGDRSFWRIWSTAEYEGKTYCQLLYKLATRMKLEGFTDKESLQMLVGWHRKHEYKIDFMGLAHVVSEAKKFTLATIRERSKNEKRRYRANGRAQMEMMSDPEYAEALAFKRSKKRAENERYRTKKKAFADAPVVSR